MAFSLLSVGSAPAQTATTPRAKVDAAHAAWRKLSQSEVNCVDKALRARNSQIWMLIQRGIGPTDSSVAGVRAGCRTQARTPAPPSTAQKPAASRTAEPPATPTNAVQAAVQANAIGSPMPRGYWSFNGSTLHMVAEGNLRKFFYDRIDPDAEAGGAQRGDLFLEGRVSDQRIVGTVYGHEGRCGRIPYRVDGTIRDGSRRLELQGQKPRVDGSCTVIGTTLDALTFRSVDAATVVASAPPAATPTAATPAIEQAVEVMAAADQTAVAAAETDDTAEFKIAADKTPVDRPAASKAAPVKVVLAAASETKVAANQAVAEKASAETAVEIARAEAARAQADAERARNEAEKAIAEAIATAASAQSKISFLYGLISGPAVLGTAALLLWLLRRKRQAPPEPSAA